MSSSTSPDPTHISRVLCPELNLLPPNTDPNLFASAYSHFNFKPWCKALLNPPSAESVPKPIAFIPQCCNPYSPAHDQFLGHTLSSQRALSHMIGFFTPLDDQHAADPSRPILEVTTLFSLGEGVSGFPGIMHGGMIMTLVDEAMGSILEINIALHKEGGSLDANSVTGRLEMDFVKGVPVPGVVCVTSKVEGMEGRKTRISCEVKDEKGTLLAKSLSTWVTLKHRL